MNALILPLLIIPLFGWAQVQTLTPKPYSDTLKPIDFREIPYAYTTSSTSTYKGHRHTTYYNHSGIQHIYSYDGIDVDNPEKELWRYMNALGDPDVEHQRLLFEDIVSRKKTAGSVGAAFMFPGIIMFLVGGLQAALYKKALSQQQQTYYSSPPTTTYTSKTCNAWSGTGDNNGTYSWTCNTDPTLTYKGQYPPSTIQVPVTTPGKTYPTTAPATVDKPTGVGFGVAGLTAMLIGLIISGSASGNQHSALLKAVQYYNRTLKQKFSWELRPYQNYGLSGISVIGHF